MSQNLLQEKLEGGGVLLGLSQSFPASGITEAMCPGYDFVWIDGQHGQHDYFSILHCMQAARAVGTSVLLRVPSGDDPCLGRYLDIDPEAIMVPMVNSAADAKRVVAAVRFPPAGQRSYGGLRMLAHHGADFPTSSKLLVVAQIETMPAVAAVGEILACQGIDGVFLGPSDLKMSAGIDLGKSVCDDGRLRDALRTVAQAAKAAGKFAGTVLVDEPSFALARDLGYRLIAVGGDSGFVRSGAAQKREKFRKLSQGGGS